MLSLNHIHLSRLSKWCLKEADLVFVYCLYKFDFRAIIQMVLKPPKESRVKTEGSEYKVQIRAGVTESEEQDLRTRV